MAAQLAHDGTNARAEPRVEVFHRARAMRRDGRAMPVTVVNLSPNGLMARCDDAVDAGDRLSVTLPVVGLVRAEVRWALGGRIGCQLEATIPANRYYELLSAIGG